MSVLREIWEALTYRTGGELPPPRPISKPVEPQPVEQEMELVMWEVDRRTGRVRMAAVRRERAA
jgi:hypothetical protein